MDSRDKEIAFLDAERVECQGKLQHELLGIGQAILAAAPPAPPDADLARRIEEARAVQTRTRQAQDLIGQVRTRAERIAAIEAIVKGNDLRVKDSMREVEHRYAEIGGMGWTVYRDKCAEKERFQEVFQPILTLEDDLRLHQKEVERLEQEGQKHGFFAKVIGRSKILLVEAKMRFRERDRTTALEEAGRRVCASKFPESVADQAFGDLMGKIVTNRKKAIDVQEETAQLRVEQARLEEDLRGLGVMSEAGSRVKELEREIAAAEKQEQEACRAIGSLVCDRNLAGQVPGGDVGLRTRTIEEVRRMIADKAGRIDRLRSAMDLDKVSEELVGLHKQRVTLETQIKDAQGKLAAVDAEIAKSTQRSLDLRARAGAEAAPPPRAETPGSEPQTTEARKS